MPFYFNPPCLQCQQERHKAQGIKLYSFVIFRTLFNYSILTFVYKSKMNLQIAKNKREPKQKNCGPYRV